MKKFKRVLALLLVGVMALAMLTACGDSGSSNTLETQLENKFMQVMNTGMGTSYTNSLKNTAKTKGLNQVSGAGLIGKNVGEASSDLVMIYDEKDAVAAITNGTPVQVVYVPVAADAGSSYKVYSFTEEQVRQIISQDVSGTEIPGMNVGAIQKFIKGIGVAAKRLDDGTYTLAFAMSMDVSGLLG